MISKNPITQQHWLGYISLSFGFGYFYGLSGHNREHKHLAHQINFSPFPNHDIKIQQHDLEYKGAAFFIKANTPHKLPPDYYQSIYIDQTHILAHTLINNFQLSNEINVLPPELLLGLRNIFQANQNIEQAFHKLMTQLMIDIPITNNKSNLVLTTLYNSVLNNEILDRNSLAELAQLSQSRFSHWFTEQFGIPLRSYRKWLRLIQAINNLQSTQNLTELAHKSQFADQAHFTRNCIEMFGITPSQLKMLKMLKYTETIPMFNYHSD